MFNWPLNKLKISYKLNIIAVDCSADDGVIVII